MDFEAVWARIVQNAGQTFHTVTGLPFTYEVTGDIVRTGRTHYRLRKADFKSAFEQMPLSGSGQISRSVNGPSCVYAVLTALVK